MPVVQTRHRIRLIIPIIVICFGWWQLWKLSQYTVDDAYITFRYAYNLAHGAGLVFNPGEHVKGYSSTLYGLIFSIIEMLGLDPNVVSKVIGAVSMAGLIIAMASACRACQNMSSTWAFCALVCVAWTPIVVWYVAGLETGLYTTLIVIGVVLHLQEQTQPERFPHSCWIFAAVALCRPEGVLFALAMFGHGLVMCIVQRTSPGRVLLKGVVPIIVYCSELGWSYSYYGQVFPQTFYAKVRSANLGLPQQMMALAEAVWHQLSISNSYLLRHLAILEFKSLTLPIVGLAGIALVDHTRWRVASAYLLAVLAQLVFIAKAGTDWMPAGRFLVPMIPFIVLLAGQGVATLAGVLRARLIRFAFICSLVFYCGAFIRAQQESISRIGQGKHVDATQHLVLGEMYNDLLEPGRTVSSFDVGGQGYASRMRIIDLGGLVDSHLGKNFSRAEKRRYLMRQDIDLMRRHPKGKGSYIHAHSINSGRYLKLSAKRLLIKRSLVFQANAPSYASRLEAGVQGDRQAVKAADAPQYASPSAMLESIIWWNDDLDPAQPRYLIAARHGRAQRLPASPVLWSFLDRPLPWDTARVFQDHVRFRAPHNEGDYVLSVKHGPKSQIIGTLRVRQQCDNTAVSALRAQASRATRGTRERLEASRRLSLFCNESSHRTIYQTDVIDFVQRQLGALQILPANEHRILVQELRFLLLRAYYDSEIALPSLRSELEQLSRRLKEL